MALPFPDATSREVDAAVRKAAACFPVFRKLDGERRAAYLEGIADGLERDASKIVALADSETALGESRLSMELARTAAEARLFADLARLDRWRETRSDDAEPDRKPFPKPALRTSNVALGPVVVIGACNFPLAISVVGTDTVSALAVGCPVVVKAHPGHPATCAKLAEVAGEAAEKAEIPAGAFSLLQGAANRVARELVEHPLTSAVAFTGSLAGGRTLAAFAAARPAPIPFHAEMGSLNPLYVLPGALRERGGEIAAGYAGAVILFAGQMCTKPGILVASDGPDLDAFLAVAASEFRKAPPVAMLNAVIRDNFEASVASLAERTPVWAESEGTLEPRRNKSACRLFVSQAEHFRSDPLLRAESFGPASLVLRARDTDELIALAREAEGSLTATLHAGPGDDALADDLLPLLERKAGRVLWNGFPPGVLPTPSTHHGGPWPAATDSRHTSIGLAAYKRFVRPVCRQGFPVA